MTVSVSGGQPKRDQVRNSRAVGERWPAQGGCRRLGRAGRGGKQGAPGLLEAVAWRGRLGGTGSLSTVMDRMLRRGTRGGQIGLGAGPLAFSRAKPAGWFLPPLVSLYKRSPCKVLNLSRKLISVA